MSKNASSQETPTNPTTFIAIAANFYGAGTTLKEARDNLVKAGGSRHEKQIVYRLPDGAMGAYVANNGQVFWFGVEGEMKPVFKYDNNKALAWQPGEDQPIAAQKPPKGKAGQPKQQPTDGATTELETKPDAVEPKPEPKPEPKKGKKKLSQVLSENKDADGNIGPIPAGDIAATVPDAEAAAAVLVDQPKDKPKSKGKSADKQAAKGKKSEPETDEGETISSGAGAEPADEETGVAAGPADFLLFVGGAFYDKAAFIEEAAKLGVSRRMPSHRLPKGLVCGQSRVFVAAGGARKSDGSGPVSEVFGYFIPQRVEFIQGPDKRHFADIVATLKLREDTKIIGSVSGEAERHCGTRKEGGTYLVVDMADSPLHVLEKPAQYEGNHFRGMLRLKTDMAEAFCDGGTVSVLIDEKCMNCGSPMKCSPDGHARAERERKRIDRGEQPKWRLLDSKCAKEVRAQRAADDGPQTVADEGAADDAPLPEADDDAGYNPLMGTN